MNKVKLTIVAVVGVMFLLSTMYATRPTEKTKTEKKATTTKVEKKSVPALSPLQTDKGIKFVYQGKASKVSLAGSFNDWRQESMQREKDDVWSLTKQLNPGKYEYKYVVDGRWILDPANKEKVVDKDGNENSVFTVKFPCGISGPEITDKGVKFYYFSPSAVEVFVAGEFNNWSATADPLTKDKKTNVWSIEKQLKPGVYKYKFVVDGAWLKDPIGTSAGDEYDNSVIKVVPLGVELGPQKVANGIKFTYYAPNAEKVYLAGEFNNWSVNSNLLKKGKKGVWEITKKLEPGSYKYKFVVDGEWVKDPFGVNAGDEYDNSLIEVK